MDTPFVRYIILPTVMLNECAVYTKHKITSENNSLLNITTFITKKLHTGS